MENELKNKTKTYLGIKIFRRSPEHVGVIAILSKPRIKFNLNSNVGFCKTKPLYEAKMLCRTENGVQYLYGKGETALKAWESVVATCGGSGPIS